MEEFFSRQWGKNCKKLESVIRRTKEYYRWEYKDLLRLTIIYILNDGKTRPEVERMYTSASVKQSRHFRYFDSERISEIDDSMWQGTLIFLFPRAKYFPRVEDYVYTSIDYGSCAVCDTLKGIREYTSPDSSEDELRTVEGYYITITETQVQDYMKLCLHLVSNMKFLTAEECDQ